MADAMSINVSTQEMRDTAQEIRQRKTTLREYLNNINKKMNDLERSWTSEAATEIRKKMNAMQGRFNEYDTVVEKYASFLVKAAEMYEETEATAKRNASAFQ